MTEFHHDTTAILTARNRTLTEALHDIDRWVDTLQSSKDANARRVAQAIDQIIEEAL